jgi:iron complex outermembrane recepter protein
MTMTMRTLRGRRMLGVSMAAVIAAFAGAAAASDTLVETTQDQAPEPAAEPIEQIAVTGTRLSRSGFTAPTPVTVMGRDRIENLSATNIGDMVQQLPSVLPSTSATTAGVTVGAGGYRTINLRGLGSPRTLVMVDGRRFVPSTAEGTVDTNLIPSVLVDRVEVVTGGASAAYGSDAVAGVVNFILDERMEGVRFSAQAGISQEGDDRDYLLSFAAGTSIMDGRGHIIVGGEYNDNQGVGNCFRDNMDGRGFCKESWQVLTNSTPGVNGFPAFVMHAPVNTALLSQDGVINSPGPLRGQRFNADGQLVPFEYGILQGLFMGGGSGYGENPFRTAGDIKTPVERTTLFSRGVMDFGGVEGFLEGSFGQVRIQTPASQTRDTALQISRDNPFLTPEVAAQMDAAGATALSVGRAGDDFGFARGDTEVQTFRVATGLSGNVFDRFEWDVYYQFGETQFDQTVSNNRINDNFTRAVDAVVDPATGQITCRSLLSPDPAVRAAAAGCAPLNIMGRNNFSAEAKAYAFGSSVQESTFRQHVIAANISGDLFDLPAGPVAAAAGAEYRQDTFRGQADPISEDLRFYLSNAATFSPPSVDVREVYAEAVAPILKGAPLAQSLEINGAVRYTDYSTSGGVTTWKLGAVYQPSPEIMIRATRSRDIRAPNATELFSPLITTFSSILDRRTGVNTLTPILRGGNEGLQPEVADTWAAGFVLTPSFGVLDGISFSADYYDIQIADAIGFVGAQTIANRCLEGASEFCANLVINPETNLIEQVIDSYLNVNELTTRGIDFELSYSTDIGELGSLTFRGLATHVIDLITTDSAGTINRAGMTGVPVSQLPGVPDWTFDGTVTWSLRDFSATLQGRYIPSGVYDVTLIGPGDPGYDISLPNSIDDNTVDSYFIANLFARYTIENQGREIEFFGGVNNLFNPDPPRAPGSQGFTNAVLFDQIGRRYTAGVRLRF